MSTIYQAFDFENFNLFEQVTVGWNPGNTTLCVPGDCGFYLTCVHVDDIKNLNKK